MDFHVLSMIKFPTVFTRIRWRNFRNLDIGANSIPAKSDLCFETVGKTKTSDLKYY